MFLAPTTTSIYAVVRIVLLSTNLLSYLHGATVNLDTVQSLGCFCSTARLQEDDGRDSTAATRWTISQHSLFDLADGLREVILERVLLVISRQRMFARNQL